MGGKKTGSRQTIKIGLDFDGVVAFNPFGVVRAPIKWFKAAVFKKTSLSFFVPKNNWQRTLWTLMHESSIFPARGTGLLKQMAKRDDIEFHLVTARFSCLEKNLTKWLKKYGLTDVFKTININRDEEQPHLFKQRVIEKLHLDTYVEDNFDIVNYLNSSTKIKIGWIFNPVDRNKEYRYKFPNLREALRGLVK